MANSDEYSGRTGVSIGLTIAVIIILWGIYGLSHM